MSFSSDLEIGHIGERVAWDWLNNQRNIRSVIDVRRDKRFQGEDVDFLIETTDRQFFKVEVKTDRRMGETGNIIYETQTTENIGCMEKTKADYLFQYDSMNNRMYVINIHLLRSYVNNWQFEELQISEDTKGYLLPIRDLVVAKIVKKEFGVQI